MEILYKGSNFSSKEISFMKSESDSIYHSDFTLKSYLSDMLIENSESDSQLSAQFNLFVKEMREKIEQRNLTEKQDSILDNRFLCSVIQFEYPNIDDEKSSNAAYDESKNKNQNKKHNQIKDKNLIESLVYALNAAITDKDGAWQWLCDSNLIIVLWGDTSQAEETIRDFIKFTESTLKITSHAGAARFPFLDFPPEMTFSNAIKALDHSAFFASTSLTFFDDVTQNIYGDRLYQFGRVEDAAKEYEKGLEIKADNFNVINSLGVCYSLMNRLDLAREQFEKAVLLYSTGTNSSLHRDSSADRNISLDTNISSDVEIDDNQFMIFYNAALTCNLMGDIKKAVEYIQHAIAITKEFFEAELTAGIVFLKADMTDKALLRLNKAVKLKPESAMVHRILGELYMQIKQPSKAANYYTRAVKLNPCDAVSMSGLARAFEVQNKNLDIALTMALKSVETAPDNPCFRTRLAKIYLKKGNYNFADSEFSRAYTQLKESEEYYKKDESKELKPLIFDSSEVEPEKNIIEQNSVKIDKLFEYEDSKSNDLKKISA